MSALTPERLAEIRERAEAATEGPWSAMGYDSNPEDRGVALLGSAATVTGSHMIGYFHVGEQSQMEADAAFTAHARTDVRDLLAEVERLRAGIAQAITKADEIAHTTGPCTGTNCAGCRTGRLEYGLRALLNPTEGES